MFVIDSASKRSVNETIKSKEDAVVFFHGFPWYVIQLKTTCYLGNGFLGIKSTAMVLKSWLHLDIDWRFPKM